MYIQYTYIRTCWQHLRGVRYNILFTNIQVQYRGIVVCERFQLLLIFGFFFQLNFSTEKNKNRSRLNDINTPVHRHGGNSNRGGSFCGGGGGGGDGTRQSHWTFSVEYTVLALYAVPATAAVFTDGKLVAPRVVLPTRTLRPRPPYIRLEPCTSGRFSLVRINIPILLCKLNTNLMYLRACVCFCMCVCVCEMYLHTLLYFFNIIMRTWPITN